MIKSHVGQSFNERDIVSIRPDEREWANTLFDEGWKLIERPYPCPELYRFLRGTLKNTRSLWITEEAHLIESLFKREIQDGTIITLTENSCLTDSFEDSMYLISYSFPFLKRIIMDHPWDIILFDLPHFPFPIRDEILFPLLKKLQGLAKNLILMTHPKESRRIKKYFPQVVLTLPFPESLDGLKLHTIFMSDQREKACRTLEIARDHEGKGVIITASREESELLEAFLTFNGFKASYIRNDLSYDQKRYIESRFNSHDHLYPLEIIIMDESTHFIYWETDVQWVIHFNFSAGRDHLYKDLAWIRNGRPSLHSYLFYSHQDKVLRESIIKECYPDFRSLRVLYSFISKSMAWGTYRFVHREKLYSHLRLSETKLDLTLFLLIHKNILQKESSVISRAEILFNSQRIQSIPDLPHQIREFILKPYPDKTREIIKDCVKEDISPHILSETLLDLEKSGSLILLTKEFVQCYTLNKEDKPSLKLGFDEVKRMIPLGERFKYLKHLERFCHNKKDFLPDKSSHIDMENPSLTRWIVLGILVLVKESPLAIGKYLIAQVLSGSQSAKVKKLSLDRLSMYSIFSLIKPEAIRRLIVHLIVYQYLDEIYLDERSLKGLRLSKKGEHWLQNKENLRKIFWKLHQNSFSNQKDSLYPLILQTLSSKSGHSPGESVLRSIAFFKPQSREELQMIKGVKEQNSNELYSLLMPFFQDKSREVPSQKPPAKNDFDFFIENEYFPILKGDFTKGYSLSSYTIPSEGRKRYTPIGRIVHNFKYKNKITPFETITDRVISLLKRDKDFHDIDILTCVPPYSKYPSIALSICEWVSQALCVPFYEDLLVRSKETLPQKSMETLGDKEKNVERVFALSETHKVEGYSVLLLDDIYDSGYTINACSKVLKSHNAKNVYVLTCTKTSYRG